MKTVEFLSPWLDGLTETVYAVEVDEKAIYAMEMLLISYLPSILSLLTADQLKRYNQRRAERKSARVNHARRFSRIGHKGQPYKLTG